MTRFDQAGQGRVPPPPPVAAAPAGNGHAAQPAGTVPSPPTLVREAAAPRRWTAKGLAAAVIFVVLGGLVVMFGVASFTKRDTVLVVAQAVPVGSTIDASDVTTAKITSDPALTPIPSGERDQVIGRVALVDLRPGTLFTRDELGTSDGFTTGQVLVALPLKQGQFPARGLAAGQSVLVVATPGSSSNSAGTAAGTTTPSTGTKAVVTEVGATDASTGVTVVDVRVAANAGVPLAQLASTGNAAVILLPPGR
jgi:SAF domain-containing protein